MYLVYIISVITPNVTNSENGIITFPRQQWSQNFVTMLRDIYTDCHFITETDSVYSAVRTGSLNETDFFSTLKMYITDFLNSINESHKDIFFLL